MLEAIANSYRTASHADKGIGSQLFHAAKVITGAVAVAGLSAGLALAEPVYKKLTPKELLAEGRRVFLWRSLTINRGQT